MSPTSMTALIVTIHDLYAIVGLIIFAALGALIYFISKKLGAPKSLSIILTLLLGLSSAFFLVNYLLGKMPLSLEVVRAG